MKKQKKYFFILLKMKVFFFLKNFFFMLIKKEKNYSIHRSLSEIHQNNSNSKSIYSIYFLINEI